MKKNGFTLAEVLITLSIIGVVATLTLPALITNTGEQQAVTALKKGLNTLTEAAQMNASIGGFDYSSATENSDVNDTNTQSLYSIFANRAAIDLAKTRTAGDTDLRQSAANYVIYFRDGSSFEFNPNDHITDNATPAATDPEFLEPDGIIRGFVGIFDMNGDKGPNLYSNCSHNQAMQTPDAATDPEPCVDKQNRVIKDKFQIRLRGSYAVPHDAAARWANGEETDTNNAQQNPNP